MTTAYLATACACWFGAGAAVAWRLTALHYRSRLKEATASEALYRSWWERDSARAIVAEAQVDLIGEQRRSAGRQSHKAEREIFRETADRLASGPAQPLRPRHEIEAEVAAIRAARKSRDPLDAGGLAAPVNRTAREDLGSPAPSYPRAGSTAAPLIDPVEQKGAR